MVYILLFILLQFGFSVVKITKPGVLGTTSNIQIQKVIELTNIERAKSGLPPLAENSALGQAATSKAANMFQEDYWAHFAPSGKTPWDFILGSGYRFSVAGENLAKNFSNAEDVVEAWMASPTHKENILNSKYRDIGIAVEDGVLNGTQATLVVQMFGTTSTLASLSDGLSNPTIIPREEYEAKAINSIKPVEPSVAKAQITKPTLIDPDKITKSFGGGIIVLIVTLLAIDLYVLRRRGVFRIGSQHLAHMAVLTVAAAAILTSNSGEILKGISFYSP